MLLSEDIITNHDPDYRFGKNVKIIHFLGSMKPWLYGFNSRSQSVIQPHTQSRQQELEHVQQWWQIFVAKIQPRLSTECVSIIYLLKLDICCNVIRPVSVWVDRKHRKAILVS